MSSNFFHAKGVDMVQALVNGVNQSSGIHTHNPGIYIHGVNCQGVARSGIAGTLCKTFPEAFTPYFNSVERNRAAGNPSAALLGDVVLYFITTQHVLAHCFTQDRYGRDKNTIYSDPAAIRSCMNKINVLATRHCRNVHYPKIGAGLGNGDWNIIHEIIEQELQPTVHRTLYTLD